MTAYKPSTILPEMRLNFNFSFQLMFHLRLQDLIFEQNFQSNNKLGALLSSQIHISKLPFAQWSSDIKVLQTPLLIPENVKKSGSIESTIMYIILLHLLKSISVKDTLNLIILTEITHFLH